MDVKYRLTAGYLLVAVLIALSGALGIYGTEKIIRLLQGKDEQLRSIIILASKLIIDTKDAETNVTTYLLLGDGVFKTRYVHRLNDLEKALATLESEVKIPQCKEVISSIKAEFERVSPSGQALLDAFDIDMQQKGRFIPSEYADLISAFVSATSNMRRYSLRLVELETDFLNRQEPITASLNLVSYAKRLQGHVLGYLLLRDKVDRKKVLDRYQSMKETISILEKRLTEPSAKEILNNVRIDMELLWTPIQELMGATETDATEKSSASDQGDLIRKVSALTDNIRDRGLALARLSVALEIEPKKLAVESARSIQFITVFVTVIPVILAIILGYLANRTANKLDQSRIKLTLMNDELAITNERLRTEILEHQRSEEEKAGLITHLQDALAQVKTLSGLIPICSSCKKIRDDKGYWHQVETYVRDHSEAEFSHSICPDCIRKLYPEIAEKVLGSPEKHKV